SIFPRFMPQRLPIKLLPVILPQGHETIHIRQEFIFLIDELNSTKQNGHFIYLNSYLSVLQLFLLLMRATSGPPWRSLKNSNSQISITMREYHSGLRFNTFSAMLQ